MRKVIALVAGVLIACGSASFALASGGTDYPGPFASDPHVPSACIVPVSETRYYFANAPAGTVELRTGGHGHGGYLKCIYIILDGPAMYPGDHPYGKWLVFPGLGLKIPQPNGIIVNYQDCFQAGTKNGLPYHFPAAPSVGPQNDCGESFLSKDGGTWHYVGTTIPMYPATTP